MKNRFTTLDVVAACRDLKQYIGMRVANIYDVNSKTYLIKLQKPEKKAVIMFESGLYILMTNNDWTKSQFPSSFSMKMRKHVKQRRLESVEQVGEDRVIDLGFGDEQSRVHVVVELYDRGNILLTDADYVILNILRPRTEKDTDVKLSVRNRYPVENARKDRPLPSEELLSSTLSAAAPNVQVRRLLAPLVPYGGALIEHALVSSGFPKEISIGKFGATREQIEKLRGVVMECERVVKQIHNEDSKGYITFKTEQSVTGDVIESFMDYHPYPFAQCEEETRKEFDTFSQAVDTFLAKMTTQKAEQRALQVERDALKKLDNVKKDHNERIQELEKSQERLKMIAERIIANKETVEKAREVVLSALAHQLSWDRIAEMCREATKCGDKVASCIVKLKLDTNEIVMRLKDPYDEDEQVLDVTIDLSLNAFQNSKKLFNEKKAAAEKKRKTEASSNKAFKNAEVKAKATLETVRVKASVVKTRKVMWFEKFLWFISRDGFIVVAGRDAQQNELLVKRYLRQGDIYVHADVRGAASVVIRNVPGTGEIPPKTLSEAAQMAVCYSNAWDAKVVASAWWVERSQVSRSAPTGEYLTPGSFMIRGKKNLMPASQLIMGLGVMFKLDEESVQRRREEKASKGSVREEEEDEKKEEDKDEELDISDNDNEDSGKDDDQTEEFPDVQVSMNKLGVDDKTKEEYSILNLGPSRSTPAMQKEMVAKREWEKEERERIEREKKEKEREAAKNKPMNKRNKHKMEKIKQKYGDQDEEEREARMALLGSRGKKNTVAEVAREEKVKEEIIDKKEENKDRRGREEERERKGGREEEREEEEEEEKEDTNEEQGLLEQTPFIASPYLKYSVQLTGSPSAEDTLLYAVVCVAPYQALADFKYKVKLTPGTGKRGKAAKSALELFLRSKQLTPREEALLKALVGDEATARNIPGKVKLERSKLSSMNEIELE